MDDKLSDLVTQHGITTEEWDAAVTRLMSASGSWTRKFFKDPDGSNTSIISEVLAHRDRPTRGGAPKGPAEIVIPKSLSPKQFGGNDDLDIPSLMKNDLANSTIANRNRRPRHGS